MECNAQYKDAPPKETVRRIKEILNSLGIKTREIFFEADGLFYSCRIEIDNCGLESLCIGTNGKGMTPEYALASGYAELMERLQNKFLVNEAMRYSDKIPDAKSLEFRFFPDEKWQSYSIHEFFKLVKNLFPNYDYDIADAEYRCNAQKGLHPEWGYSLAEWRDSITIGFLGLPYMRFKKWESSMENVPIVVARANSSTGLCAGNTPHEAILQGINEIFERYVLQFIYLNNVTPPSFPEGYFDGSIIADRLKELEAVGYVYDIKDMSLGRGFPVVGVILTNTANGTTMFRMGADLRLEIALERCLTEIFQGRAEGKTSRFIEYPIHENLDMSSRSYMKSNISMRNNEYLKSLKDGTGLLPNSLFLDMPTYGFSEPVLHASGVSKADLSKVFEFLFDRGFDVLIRDNSFLGFPSYHVIIPGLSEQSDRLKNIFGEYFDSFSICPQMDNFRYCECGEAKQWALYNIKAEDDVRDFVLNHYPNDDTLRLAPYCTAPQNQVNKHLLLFLSAVKNKDFKDANVHFKRLMQQRQKQGLPYNEYMACIGSYVCRKSLNDEEPNIRAWLRHFYSAETIQEVIRDFCIPDDIMSNYSFPTCFDCQSCSLVSECHYKDAVAFEDMIQNVQKSNPVYQIKLLELFH